MVNIETCPRSRGPAAPGKRRPVPQRIGNCPRNPRGARGGREILAEEDAEAEGAVRISTRTGRPAGDRRFVSRVERLTGRNLIRGRPGPRPRKRGRRGN